MIVHGASRGQNNFTLNGANFTNYSQTAGFNPPPPDAVQEIRVQTSAFSAEFGNNAGAQVTHGHQGRQQPVPWVGLGISSQRQAERAELLRAAEAGSAAEPVGRVRRRPASCRTNCSSSARTRNSPTEPRPSARQATVLTDAQRAGDFTGARDAVRNPTDGITGQPFTNRRAVLRDRSNVINPDCISPVAKNYLESVHPAVGVGDRRETHPVAARRVSTSSPASTTRSRPRTRCTAISSRTTTSASARRATSTTSLRATSPTSTTTA